jgi:hypothetical protein
MRRQIPEYVAALLALLLFVCAMLLFAGVVYAGDPPANDERGTDPEVKPTELTVFMAKAIETPWSAITVIGRHTYPTDHEWAINEDGLKICRRTFVYVVDLAAEQAKIANLPVAELHPDATKPSACARLGMMIDRTKVVGKASDWWVYKVACPQRSLDEKGRTVFADPTCPHDCLCIDEPETL